MGNLMNRTDYDGKMVTFPPGNKVEYAQGFSCGLVGVPPFVFFAVSGGLADKLCLSAGNYGGEPYGGGPIYVKVDDVLRQLDSRLSAATMRTINASVNRFSPEIARRIADIIPGRYCRSTRCTGRYIEGYSHARLQFKSRVYTDPSELGGRLFYESYLCGYADGVRDLLYARSSRHP